MEQVVREDHPDDPVDVLAVNGESAEPGRDERLADVLQRRPLLDGRDLRPRHHRVLYAEAPEFEHVRQDLRLLLVEVERPGLAALADDEFKVAPKELLERVGLPSHETDEPAAHEPCHLDDRPEQVVREFERGGESEHDAPRRLTQERFRDDLPDHEDDDCGDDRLRH